VDTLSKLRESYERRYQLLVTFSPTEDYHQAAVSLEVRTALQPPKLIQMQVIPATDNGRDFKELVQGVVYALEDIIEEVRAQATLSGASAEQLSALDD
jgi:hypothetical protein